MTRKLPAAGYPGKHAYHVLLLYVAPSMWIVWAAPSPFAKTHVVLTLLQFDTPNNEFSWLFVNTATEVLLDDAVTTFDPATRRNPQADMVPEFKYIGRLEEPIVPDKAVTVPAFKYTGFVVPPTVSDKAVNAPAFK